MFGWFVQPAHLASLGKARLATCGERFQLACVGDRNSGKRKIRDGKQVNQTVCLLPSQAKQGISRHPKVPLNTDQFG